MSEAALDPFEGRLASLWSRITAFAAKWPGLTSAFLGLVAALGYPPVHGWWVALPALAFWIAIRFQSYKLNNVSAFAL